ncbi:hypothetical protein WN943_027710 [Citrus x changshan-huyou]
METEELIRRCKAITLRESEKSRVAIGDVMKGKGRKLVTGCLLGKVLHPRGVSREGIKSALQQVWKTAEGFKVESLGSKTFVFKFASEADKKRVLSRGPWHFERALIVLKEPSGIGEIAKQSFTQSAFWVQLHNVLVGCMEQETVRMLGETIGKVEEVDVDEEGECIGQYARDTHVRSVISTKDNRRMNLLMGCRCRQSSCMENPELAEVMKEGNRVVANRPITHRRQGTRSKGEILTLNIKSSLNGTRPMRPQANQAQTKKTYTWQSIKMALQRRWRKIN